MEIRPAEVLGGGASSALCHPALRVAERSKLAGYATNSGFSDCSGEYGGIGERAGSVPWTRQQAGSIFMPGIAPSCAIPSQQAGRALDCIVRTQADTGMAVHRITAASMSNATFLPQCMKVVSQFQLKVSTHALRVRVSLVTFQKSRDRRIDAGPANLQRPILTANNGRFFVSWLRKIEFALIAKVVGVIQVASPGGREFVEGGLVHGCAENGAELESFGVER